MKAQQIVDRLLNEEPAPGAAADATGPYVPRPNPRVDPDFKNLGAYLVTNALSLYRDAIGDADRLEHLGQDLGYSDLDEFLGDNPGLQSIIVETIIARLDDPDSHEHSNMLDHIEAPDDETGAWSPVDGQRIFDKWADENKAHHFEMSTDNLEKLLDACGHDSIGSYIDDLDRGEVQGMFEWIGEWVGRNEEWREKLQELVDLGDDREPEENPLAAEQDAAGQQTASPQQPTSPVEIGVNDSLTDSIRGQWNMRHKKARSSDVSKALNRLSAIKPEDLTAEEKKRVKETDVNTSGAQVVVNRLLDSGPTVTHAQAVLRNTKDSLEDYLAQTEHTPEDEIRTFIDQSLEGYNGELTPDELATIKQELLNIFT